MPIPGGFFDGQYKATSRVNLGGASRDKSDRAHLLEQSRRDRERRSQLRAETRSATRIQVRSRNFHSHSQILLAPRSQKWFTREERGAARARGCRGKDDESCVPTELTRLQLPPLRLPPSQPPTNIDGISTPSQQGDTTPSPPHLGTLVHSCLNAMLRAQLFIPSTTLT